MIQKSDYSHNKQIRTLVLSTNANDYDTGEPIVEGSIRKTLTSSNSSHRVDNPILLELNGIKVGRKYYSPISSKSIFASDDHLKPSNLQQSLLPIS